MCEGDICEQTGVDIEKAPCRVGTSFLTEGDVREKIKSAVFDLFPPMIQTVGGEGFSEFINSGYTGQKK